MSKSILEQFGEAIKPITEPTEEGGVAGVIVDWINERIAVAKQVLQDNDKNTAKRSLSQSIEALPLVFEDGKINIQVEANDYWDFVNSGVDGARVKRGSPYSYSNKQPPVNSILEWIKDRSITTRRVIDSNGAITIKQLTSDKDYKGLAYGIARSIRVKGTEATPFMNIAFSDEAVEELISRIKLV